MRFPLSRRSMIHLGLLVGVWTAYGILCGWQVHYWYAFTKTPMSWADAFRFELSYAYLWCAASPLILWLAKRFRIERNGWPARLLIHLAVLIVLVPVIKIAFDLIVVPPTTPFKEFTWQKLFRSVEMDFDTGTLLYAVLLLVEHAIIYYHRYQAGIVQAAQLQTQLVQAQLQALKMQLHPHFLFNTLHTITALVHEDPELAERTITRLGELLRLFLANSTIHEVPLSEELHILDLYLQIERARFEERLQVHYDVPDQLRQATVPSLVLQPLVENSIRHGLGRRARPGLVSVSAERVGDTLVLRIKDNGVGFAPESEGPLREGMGLAITRGRLQSLYGGEQSLTLRNLPDGGAEARIVMPFRSYELEAPRREKDHAELQSADC